MHVRALIRGSESGSEPQKRSAAAGSRSKLPLPHSASLRETKRQHLMRIERVLQIHRDWVLRHGRIR